VFVTALLLWGTLIEPNLLDVNEIEVPLRDLPPEFEGLVIAHMSDFHLDGTRNNSGTAEQACRVAMEHHPDMICLTGDIIDHNEYLPVGANLIHPLHAPLGVWMVLGNHDCNATMEDLLYGHPVDQEAEEAWRRVLQGSQVEILDNDSRMVARGERRVVVAGIGDVSCGRDDLRRTLRAAPSGDLHLLLTHSPDLLDSPGVDWADLILAGHTHGGQMQIPGLGSVWAPVWRYRHRASGLLPFGRGFVHVTRGVGAGVRTRINCRPQLALLRLVRAPDEN
jgi:predicted MPP superfamily phosphohydrolase